MHIRILLGSWADRNHWEDLNVDGSISKLILDKQNGAL
jgi:hypothetical protein